MGKATRQATQRQVGPPALMRLGCRRTSHSTCRAVLGARLSTQTSTAAEAWQGHQLQTPALAVTCSQASLLLIACRLPLQRHHELEPGPNVNRLMKLLSRGQTFDGKLAIAAVLGPATCVKISVPEQF